MENILSKINKSVLEGWFAWMPDGMDDVFIYTVNMFVGKQWHITTGVIFMLVIIFLPGGLVELGKRTGRVFRRRDENAPSVESDAAEQRKPAAE